VCASAIVSACATLATGAAHPQATPACRTYATEQTRAFSTGGSASERCEFNQGTSVLTCTLDQAIPVRRRIVSVRQYGSTADFVDEIRVVPPRSLARSETTTYVPAGPGAQNARLTFDHDAQRRQTGLLFQIVDGPTIKTIYSSWDAFGRPTAHTTGGQVFKSAYDDTNRTMTVTGPGGVQVRTFDQHGNAIREANAPAGGAPSATTITIQKTVTACR
jgi:hypothetical protein